MRNAKSIILTNNKYRVWHEHPFWKICRLDNLSRMLIEEMEWKIRQMMPTSFGGIDRGDMFTSTIDRHFTRDDENEK